MLSLLLLLAFPEDVIDEAGVPVPEPKAATKVEAAQYQPVHWSQVQPRQQVSPDFPAGHGGESATCHVRVFVDQRGEVDRVSMEEGEGCSEDFAASAMTAAEGWLFRPIKMKRKKIHATFVVVFEFNDSAED